VLGGGEVTLLEMTHAYGVFANEGVRVTPRSILRIEDTRGTVLEEFLPQEQRVLDPNVTRMISDVLSDNVARTPLWGSNSLVNFTTRDVASKTGSTNNLRDAWLMGYTPNLAVGTWVGNNDNSPMGGGLSGLIVTPMWREFFDFALTRIPEQTFTEPEVITSGIKPIIRGEYIDTSILLSNIENSETGLLDFNAVSQNIHSILHFVDKQDPLGPYPTNPRKDDQYENWEYAVQAWNRNTFGSFISTPSTTPSTTTE